MSETQLMNDEAARSATGEILDQSTLTTTPTTQTPTTEPSTTSATTTPATDGTTPQTPAKDGTAPAPVVPETYADFKAPDNYTIDPTALAAATPVFKELGLTQDQAQKLVDLQVAREIALAKAPQDAVETMRKEWRGKTEADPDIKATVDKNSGKTGMDAVKVNIARTLSVLPVDLQVEFKDAMNLTGAGDHPAFVKAFNKLAAFVTEGSHVAGAGPSPDGQKKPGTPAPTAAAALYPNLPRG
jgi:antitoxin component of RelBE/YafQ-DinJ toxin-antitoxin module